MNSRQQDRPRFGPVLKPVQLAIPSTVDLIADLVEGGFVARIGERVEPLAILFGVLISNLAMPSFRKSIYPTRSSSRAIGTTISS